MNAFEVVGKYIIEGVESALSGVRSIADAAETSSERLQGIGERLSDVGRATQSFGNNMTKYVTGPIAAAGAGMVALANNVAGTADTILDLADATGLSTDEVQRWRFVAQAAGVSSDAMLKGLDRLSRMQSSVTSGTGDAAMAFQRLGINAQRFYAVNPAQRTRILAEAFGRIADPAQRAAIGTQLFSRRWFEVAPILSMGAQAIDGVIAANERFVISNDELVNAGFTFRNQMNQLTNVLNNFRMQLGLAFIDVMQETVIPFLETRAIPMIENLIDTVVGVVDAFASLPAGMQSFIIKAILFAAVLGPIISVLGTLVLTIGGLVTFIAPLAGGFAALAGAVAAAVPVIIAVVAAVSAAIYIFRNWDQIVTALGNLWGWLTVKASEFSDWLAGAFVDVLANVIASVILFGNQIRQRFQETWDASMTAVRDFTTSVVNWFRALPGQVIAAIRALPGAVWAVLRNMGQGMVNIVTGAINNVISRFRNMYREIVGNSIVPDMRVGVKAEMEGMADESEASSARLARAVSGNFTDVAGSANRMGSAVGTGQGSNGSGGNTVIDMRHAIIRDDRDLLDRLRRRGIGTLGGLA